MRIADLLSEHSLQLRLQTPSDTERLQHEVSGSAPTELIDPTPFLPRNALVVVSGIAMNFQEERAWDAYVERLANVPVSGIAFATGIAHRVLPKGLITACVKHQVPLIEIPSIVPSLQLNRHVESVLRAERVALSSQGWDLADECARLANNGAQLVTLLATIHRVVEAPLAIYDAFGSVLAKYPEHLSWQAGLKKKPAAGITRIQLPMGVKQPCFLEIRELNPELPITSLLGPASSILALHLNRTVLADASRHQEMRNFIEQCGAWDESSHADVAKAFQLLEFDNTLETILLVADMSGEFSSTSWQLRTLLHEQFERVCITEIGSTMFALAQEPKFGFEEISQRLLTINPAQPLLLRSPAHTMDELRLAVVHLQRLLPRVSGPCLAPVLSIEAIVDVTAGRGARDAARAFLQPLKDLETHKSETLFHTLKTYLDHNAQPSKTCEALFIHRNSLNYRIRKIEQLLDVNLNSLDGLMTCSLALNFSDELAPQRVQGKPLADR